MNDNIIPWKPHDENHNYSDLRALSGKDAFAKRAFDIIGSLGLIMLFSPLMILAAIMIKLDSKGGVFFLQERTGQFCKSFKVIKFRTMAEHNTPQNQLDYIVHSDPRITRIGRIFRNTSIDEIPQLFNVLKGDMSLVGPRPQPVFHLEHYGKLLPDYALRHLVKPGITGVVQTHQARALVHHLDDHKLRLSMDLDYIRHWGFWSDVWLCLITPVTMIFRYNSQVKEFPAEDAQKQDVNGSKSAMQQHA